MGDFGMIGGDDDDTSGDAVMDVLHSSLSYILLIDIFYLMVFSYLLINY